MTYPPQNVYGSFVEETAEFDTSFIQDIDVNSQTFKDLIVQLYQNVNNIATILNTKDSGYYVQQEFVTGTLWFPRTGNDPLQVRSVWRKVIDFGQLPNTSIKSVAHGITIDTNNDLTFTRIYATATDPVAFDFIPIPYTLTNPIKLFVTQNNVNIETSSDRTRFTRCFVVLEYLKE